ncbi:MAG: response regulator [Patescibacteria group bacterium]
MTTQLEQKKLILIVEDESSMSQILKDQFEESGFAVLVATDGDDGLTKALENHPNLILLDILMPHTNGIVMLKNLRKDPWGEKVPVVVLTNLNDINTLSLTLKEKAYDYLVKADWDLDKIVQHVKDKLKAMEVPKP